MAPYIDLRDPPYNVVANDQSPSVVSRNTAGINQAILMHSGSGANLVLPGGEIFVEEQEQVPGGPEIRWCIKFGTGISRLTLSGQGMFATTLIQLCEGDGGELNLLNIDGSSFIELADLGFRQDRITTPDPIHQNHLVAVYNNTRGGTTEHIRGRNLFFGKCIGDAIRILADHPSDHVVDVRFSIFTMVLNGVVTSEPPNGRTGARSGIALQRGGVDCTFGNFSIVGPQNSAIDEEPSGGAFLRTCYHDFTIDNTISSTGTAVSLGGKESSNIAFDGRIHDGYIRGGQLAMLGPTSGYKLERLTIECTEPPKAGAQEPLLLIRSPKAGHTDLELNDITLKRTGTSADGDALDIMNTGNRTTIRNLHVVQGVSGCPVAIDGANRLNLEGYRLQYDGPRPEEINGVLVEARNSDVDDLRISDANIVSSTGKLCAAVRLNQRLPRTMARIKISDVRSACSASFGVYMSFDTREGSTPDQTPEISGIANGSDVVWTQRDEGDDPINSVFPIISGNRGDICTFVGEAPPEGVLTAIQGCTCIRKNGDEVELFFKRTTTGNTGWVQIPVP